MNLALILLKTGQTLIAQSEELDYEPRVHLIEPHEVSGKTKITLTPWPCHTDDKHVLLNSGDLLTVVTPTQSLSESYLKKVGKTLEDLQPKENRIQLNEGDLIPDPPEDGYEPYYVEEQS